MLLPLCDLRRKPWPKPCLQMMMWRTKRVSALYTSFRSLVRSGPWKRGEKIRCGGQSRSEMPSTT